MLERARGDRRCLRAPRRAAAGRGDTPSRCATLRSPACWSARARRHEVAADVEGVVGTVPDALWAELVSSGLLPEEVFAA